MRGHTMHRFQWRSCFNLHICSLCCDLVFVKSFLNNQFEKGVNFCIAVKLQDDLVLKNKYKLFLIGLKTGKRQHKTSTSHPQNLLKFNTKYSVQFWCYGLILYISIIDMYASLLLFFLYFKYRNLC